MLGILSRTLFIRNIITISLLFCLTFPLLADNWINSQYNTTEGTEFYATFLKNLGAAALDADNLTLYLHAASEEGAEVTVTYLSDNTTEKFRVNPNSQKTIQIELSKAYVDYLDKQSVENQISKKGLYVTSTNPISLYVTSSRNGAYGGTCILPVSALEREYVIQTYYGDTESTMFAVVGTADGTKVEMNIKKTELEKELYKDEDVIEIDTVIYENLSITLQEGEVFLYRSGAFYRGLSGTSICADKPIAVFNGHQAAQIPYYAESTNHLSVQTYPTDKWGKQYVVTPTKNYSNNTEHVRITSFNDNTKINKNGRHVCTLQAFETFHDTINDQAIYYSSNNLVACYMYTLGKQAVEHDGKNSAARPSMTPITPLEYATHSLLFATFTESKVINQHYVNIVVPEQYVGGMRLDGQRINTPYRDIQVGNKVYKYAQLPVSSTAHYLENINAEGAFTARIYGMGTKKGGGEFYAYSAGSRVNRSADILIDNKYINEERICINQSLDFTSIIGFDYERLEWEIQDDTLFYSTDSIIKDYFFSKADTNEVRLYVYSRTPICNNELVDTVVARIIVDTLTKDDKNYKQCYGGMFDFTYKGIEYHLAADTITEHNVDGKKFKFEINIPIVFEEIIQQTNTCDIRRKHTLVLRPTYNHVFDTVACGILHWEHEKNNKIDTVYTFRVEPGDKLPVFKEHTIDTFKTKYGCDSIVTWRVMLNRSYTKDTTVTVCQTDAGEKFEWIGHDSIDIPIDKVGTFTYVDNLKTIQAPYCDSIHVLHLTVNPRYEFTILDTICQNASFDWDVNKVRYVGSSFPSSDARDIVLFKTDSIYTFTEKMQTEHGCDSIYHLQLVVSPVYDTIVVVDMCDNAEYSFNDTIYRGEKLDSQNGLKAQLLPYEYTHVLSTKNGCDSVVTLQLYVHPTDLTTDTVIMCQGENGVYDWKRDGVSPPFWCEELGKQVDEITLEQVGTFTYIDSTLTPSGCDNIHILYLTVGGFAIEEEPKYICDNDTLVWHNRLYVGHNFNQPYDPNAYEYVTKLQHHPEQYAFKDSILETSIQGCDSTHFLTLYIAPSYITPVKIDTISICDNFSYTFYDSIYNQQGEWISPTSAPAQYTLIHTDTTVFGCDSVVMHVVNVHPTYEFVVYDTICQHGGGFYEWTNHSHPLYCEELQSMVATISTSDVGEFTLVDSLKSTTCVDCVQGVCDSVYILHLNVIPSYNIIDTVVIMSAEDVFTWKEDSITYGGSDTNIPCDTIIHLQYPDTFIVTKKYETTSVGTYVCDSIRILKLIIGNVTRDTLYDVACSNQPYLWYGKDQYGNDFLRYRIDNPKDSIYLDAYKTTLGLDSIYCLNLTVSPAYEDIDTMTTRFNTCQYSNYKWIRNGYACSDKLFCINTNQWVSIMDTIPTKEIGTFVYVDSLKTQSGCDSVWTLQLTVESLYRDTLSMSICENDYVIWENTIYKGMHCTDILPNDTMPVVTLLPQLNYFVDTTYVTSDGCDSTKCLNLNIYPIYASVDTVVIGDNNSPYIWETRDAYGVYYDTIRFTQKPIYIDPITQVHKKDTILIQDKYHTLTSVNGCDSIANLHLVINPTYLFLTEDTICSGDYYEWRGYRKHWKGGSLLVVKDSFQTADGCDSIYQLNLYLKPNSVTHRYRDVCYNDTVYHEDFLVWGPGMDPEDVIKDVVYVNAEGCDSIIRYSLTLHPTYHIGVDSIYTICTNDTFELHKSYIYTPEQKYYEPGEIAPILDVFLSDTLQTTTCSKCPDHGCDSIYYAHLRILPAYKHADYDTICSSDTLIWRGMSCYNAKSDDYVYYDSLLTTSGCDSIYELYLHVKQSYAIALPPDTICADDSIFFAGKYINQSGIYLDTMSTMNQCDSILYIELTVLDTTSLTIYDTICVTEKYLLDTLYSNRRIFTETGYYVDTALNAWGCKHFTHLHLEVIDTTKYTLQIGNICADDEEIAIHYTYTGRHLIEYSIIFDSLGLSQGFENIDHAPLDPNQSSIYIPIPQGPALPHPETNYFDSQQGVNTFIYEDKYTYPQPNQYRITVIMHNGICGDTLQRKDTTLHIMYPSWIHEQHWNDGIILYNDTYNGGYEFSAYQWYQNGEPLIGETKEYLYLPNGLLLNNRGDCDNYYQVLLTREDDGYSAMTCPICPIYLTNDTIVPRLDYFSIVPTLVVKENPVVHILSTMRGTCMGYDAAGVQLFETFDFAPDVNNYAGSIALPVHQSGIVYIKLSTQNGDNRIFKVLVK